MAGTLSRVTTFVAATPILSSEVNAELNQLVNLLNSTSSNIKLSVKVSDAGDAPIEANQLSTGPIQKWLQAGVLKAQISNAGNYLFGQSGGFIGDQNANEYLKFATVASAVNELEISNAATVGRPKIALTGGDANIGLDISPKGTGQVFITGSSPLRLPAVAPSDNNDAVRKSYVDDRKVSFSASFFITDPSTANLNTADFGAILIPGGGQYTITKIKVFYRTGSHTSGGSVTFNVIRAGVGSIGTINLDNTNSVGGTVYTNDISDINPNENEVFWVEISARSGTVTERNASLIVEGFRTGF